MIASRADAAALLFVASSLALAACAELPPISAQQCGNGVVEPPESCDTFAPDAASSCRPPGTVGACHLDCRRRSDGSRPACPAGWGCDPQGICLRPTGEFIPLSEIEVGAAQSLLAGDFDGDGRADVLSREPRDTLGRTRLHVHYFAQDGTLDEARDFPKPMATPAIVDLSADGRSDFAATNASIGLVLGRADRSLVPEAFGSYRFRGARVRTISVFDDWLSAVPSLVDVTAIDGVPGLYAADQNGVVRGLGGPRVAVEDLAGDLVTGDVIEGLQISPCREVIIAAREATSFWLVDVCTRDPASGAVIWRERADSWTVPLDPPAAIDSAPLVADMNGDDHLDVLVSAGGRLYVSFGDGDRLATATPYTLAAAGAAAPVPIAMPLAAGDVTGDGAVDFVFEDHLLLSRPAPSGLVPVYTRAHINRDAPWTVARIADLNGNGQPDVIAASSAWLGATFFNASGGQLTAFNVPTHQPVSLLEVGDFDGDLVHDVALVERAPDPGERDTITIAFGDFAAPPATPVPVARIRHIEQLSEFRRSNLGSLMVASTETSNGTKVGVLAWLEGSGDRVPFAPYQLASATEGTVFSAAALGVAAGQFAVPGRHDVLALAIDTDGPAAFQSHFWLLPAPLDPSNGAKRIGGALDPRLRPLVADADGFRLRVGVAAATADFDGDGRDDAVWAMPADEDQSCGVKFTSVLPDGTLGVAAGGTMFVDEPCLGPQLATLDGDGDGAADVALLTGAPGEADRKLFVFWNDGQGGFSASNGTRIGALADSPQQFAVLPAALERPIGFAYVTADRAAVVTAVGAPRLFGLPKMVAALQSGTGITVADVDGDGIADLTVAAAGNLRVLKAELEAP